MRIHRAPLGLALIAAFATTSVAQELPVSEQISLLQAHYAKTEAELRAADTSHLSDAQRQARAFTLDALHEYWIAAEFGRSDAMLGRRGVSFVDDCGRRCAVAYLLDATGEAALVESVAASANHAYLLELADDTALVAWLERVGMTVVEAARIQGPYVVSWEPPMLGPKIENVPAPVVVSDATSRRPSPATASNTGGSSPGSAGSASRTGGRGSSPRGGATTTSTTGEARMEDWWRWWETNKLRFMQPNRLVEESARAPGRYAYGVDLLPGVAEAARVELIPLLEQHCGHPDAIVRQRAVAALGRLGGADAVPRLISMLDDGSLYVREGAILALGATGSMRAVPTLLRIAADGGTVSTARPLALLALGIGRRHGLGTAVDGFVAAIVEDLAEEDHEQLGTAAMLYHTLAYTEDISAYVRDIFANEDVSTLVRCRATESLRLSGDGADLPPLTHALVDRNLQVRRSAAIALGGFSHPLVLPRLQTAYELESEPMTRGFILLAIGEQGGKIAREFLIDVMSEGSSGSRPWAALALGILARSDDDAPARKAILAGLAEESNQSHRGAYVLASGIALDHAAGRMLADHLTQSKSPRQRMFAALALAMSGAPEARGALREQLETESSPLPRVALAQALGILGLPDDADLLVQTLRDTSAPDMQLLVAVALGFHGTEGSVQGLLELVRSKHTGATARAAALDALGLLLDDSPGLQLADVSSSANFDVFPGWFIRALTTTTL